MAATAILFDLDGTVWDSYPCYAAALYVALGSAPEEVEARLRDGENVVALARSAGLSNARFTNLCRGAVTQLRIYPNVQETLSKLRGKDLPMGVVTNIPQRLIVPLLSDSGLEEYFTSVICAARKPSGTGILRALNQIGVAPNEKVYYVGDLLSDAMAAANAGVSFAWAAYGYRKEAPLESAVRLDNFSALLDLL